VANEIRANFSFVSCLLEIAKARGGVHDVKGKNAVGEERTAALDILACGAFGWRMSSVFDWEKLCRYFAKSRAVPAAVGHRVG